MEALLHTSHAINSGLIECIRIHLHSTVITFLLVYETRLSIVIHDPLIQSLWSKVITEKHLFGKVKRCTAWERVIACYSDPGVITFLTIDLNGYTFDGTSNLLPTFRLLRNNVIPALRLEENVRFDYRSGCLILHTKKAIHHFKVLSTGSLKEEKYQYGNPDLELLTLLSPTVIASIIRERDHLKLYIYEHGSVLDSVTLPSGDEALFLLALPALPGTTLVVTGRNIVFYYDLEIHVVAFEYPDDRLEGRVIADYAIDEEGSKDRAHFQQLYLVGKRGDLFQVSISIEPLDVSVVCVGKHPQNTARIVMLNRAERTQTFAAFGEQGDGRIMAVLGFLM